MRRPREGALAARGVLEAVRRVVHPLACLAAREGITAEAFAAAARAAFPTGGGRPPPALASGAVSQVVEFDTALRLIGRWLGGPPFAARGHPRALPRHGRGSFEELAARVGVDPSRMLADLHRVGAVRLDGRGRVALVDEAYLPTTGVAEKLDILGRDAAEFIETVVHNLTAPPVRGRLQRKASYDNIGSTAVPAVRRRLRELALQALREANAALAEVDRDRNPQAPGGRRTRMSFGIYLAEANVGAGARGRTRSGAGAAGRKKTPR